MSGTVVAVMAIMAVAATIVSCNKSDPQVSEKEILIFIPAPEAGCEKGNEFVYVTASGSWTLELSQSWARLDQTQGVGDAKGITLFWDENCDDASRSCILTLTCAGKVCSAVLKQEGKVSDPTRPTGLVSETLGDWLEIPAAGVVGMYYFHHDMTVAGKTVRNYSFCLDPDAKIARWVAYPLNKSLIGSGSRTNAWGLDPKVPTEYQPVLFSGFYGSVSGEWYQRGHQLPSADRYISGANQSTFYGTNLTPQRGVLNKKVWGTLEGMIRSWSYQFDTLYVVTGADPRGCTDWAYDNYHKKIAVPNAYWKALLGYKKNGTLGITGTTGGYTGIAFWFGHADCGSGKQAALDYCMTIDALETKVDEDLFPGLSSRIGVQMSEKVESTLDPWWSK